MRIAHLYNYLYFLTSQITSRFAFCGMRPMRAAALPVSAVHIINIGSYQPAPQYGNMVKKHTSATPERAVFDPL